MPEIPKFFVLSALGLGLIASGAFAQGPPRLKAPIRVNLLEQNPETKQSKSLAERLRSRDDLRLPDDNGGDSFLSQDQLPDFSQGDIVDDGFDMEEKKEDFLNPEFLKQVDGADAFRNDQLEALRGELELEGEEDRDVTAEESRIQKERMELMRELSGQEEEDFLETKGKLAEPKRGPPSSDANRDQGRGEDVDRSNRASVNLNIRDTEKNEDTWGSNDNIGRPGNAKSDGKAFSNANSGSLIDGLISGNKDRLSMLDSLNKKYGTFDSSSRDNGAEQENRRPRVRRAFVENEDGGVGWRADLRPAERNRRLDTLAPTRERDNRMSDGLIAGFTNGSGSPGAGGRSDSLRLPGTSLSTSGSNSSVATLRIGAGSKSTNSRALPGSRPTRPSRGGFDMGTGLGSSFDTGPIKSPFKF